MQHIGAAPRVCSRRDLFEDALLSHASTRGLIHHRAHDLLDLQICERVDDVRHGGDLFPRHMIETDGSVACPNAFDRRRPSAVVWVGAPGALRSAIEVPYPVPCRSSLYCRTKIGLNSIGAPMPTSVVSLSEFKAKAAQMLEEIKASPTEIIITQRGSATAVVQSYASYQRTQEALLMLKLMVQGEADVREGRVTAQRKVFSSLRRQIRDG